MSADVEVRVRLLLVRQLDVEADREAAGLPRAAVRGLHHAGAAAGDDREARLREPPARHPRIRVGRVVLPHPRRAEDRYRRPVDSLDRLEALVELLRDPRDVAGEVAVLALEEPPVFH